MHKLRSFRGLLQQNIAMQHAETKQALQLVAEINSISEATLESQTSQNSQDTTFQLSGTFVAKCKRLGALLRTKDVHKQLGCKSRGTGLQGKFCMLCLKTFGMLRNKKSSCRMCASSVCSACNNSKIQHVLGVQNSCDACGYCAKEYAPNR